MVATKPLGAIDFGVPDANAEYFIAKQRQRTPIFLDAYINPPSGSIYKFIEGTKFFVFGHKGTGKTAILRRIQDEKEKSGFTTQFLIFRDEIYEEKDLIELGYGIIKKEDIKKFTHYLHAVKRLILFTILAASNAQLSEDEFPEDSCQSLRRFIPKLKHAGINEIIQTGFDSVRSVAESLEVDIDKISEGKLGIDVAKYLKRENDVLLNRLCEKLKTGKQVAIFVDEIHFAYANEKTFRQDAMLVRDTVIAIRNLNQRFINEGIKTLIYGGFRSEFLSHPVIASADVAITLASFGEEISWAFFKADADNPILDVAAKRVEISLGQPFSRTNLISLYLGAVQCQ